jgi:hypothetical protein
MREEEVQVVVRLLQQVVLLPGLGGRHGAEVGGHDRL